MQAVNSNGGVPRATRLTIRGAFWDSQIYAGDLYLFTADGSLLVLDWSTLVGRLQISDDLRVASSAAFLGNQRFYGPGAFDLIHDPEVRPVLVRKFDRLAALDLTFDNVPPEFALERDNPFPFPHSDSELHYDRLLVGSKAGVYGVNRRSLQSPRPEVSRAWDGPVFGFAASHRTLAVAAGTEGLFEVPTGAGAPARGGVAEPRQVATEACTACEWAYWSVFASAPGGPGFLAAFSRVRQPPVDGGPRYLRTFDRVVSADALFEQPDLFRAGEPGFTWGGKDKLYRQSSDGIEVVRYNPRGAERSEDEEFLSLGKLPFTPRGGEIVSARVVPFGTVLELDDALVVFPSLGEILTLPGEPVNWRVFPRSENYMNQLHIIYEDRLEIWAFNHDYFADQHQKLAGSDLSRRDEW